MTGFAESGFDMLRLTFATWLMVFPSTSTDLCKHEYDVMRGCDEPYGNVTETLSPVTSKMECVNHCNGHNRCLSVKHDVINNVCQLNSERFISISTGCPIMLEYAKLTKRSCGKLINQDCTESGECSFKHSQCYLNKCRCEPGYSYKYVDESCVPYMLRLTFATWLMVFPSATTDLCKHEYDVMRGCDELYGNVTETLSPVTSTMECVTHCNGHDRCLSVKHDVINNVCQLNSERFISIRTGCPTMLDYAKLTKRSCGKLINQDCSVSGECSVHNSQCFLEKCRCYPGYSYKYVDESCVRFCDAYGSSFTVYVGTALFGHDRRAVSTVSLEVCEQMCVVETTFVCRSFDYDHIENTCYLSVQTALTKPIDYGFSHRYYYYHRNCQ